MKKNSIFSALAQQQRSNSAATAQQQRSNSLSTNTYRWCLLMLLFFVSFAAIGANTPFNLPDARISPVDIVPSITKSANGSTFASGSTVTYTIIVCAATQVTNGVVSDVLAPEFNPATVVSSDFTVSGNTLTSGNLSLIAGCQTLTYSVQINATPLDCCSTVIPNCATFTYNTGATTACTDIILLGNATYITGNISSSGLGSFISNTTLHVSGTLTINTNTAIQASSICFDPAAQIVVQPGITLVIETSTLFACSQMWKGMLAQASPITNGGGKIILNYCTIRDAQYAVQAENNTNIQTIGNLFEDNYVSIYTPTSGTKTIAHNIRNNTFLGTGTLNPPYAGQTPALGTTPFAGIYFGNAVLLTVGSNTPGSENTFSQLNAGIISVNENVTSRRNSFTNIQPDPAYATIAANGWGVFALGSSGNFDLKVSGFGGAATDPANFSDCSGGIYAYNINSSLIGNNMQNILQCGILQRFSTNRVIYIGSNNILTRFWGIRLAQNDPANNLDVRSNTINLAPLIATPNSAGIDVAENNNLHTNAYIYNNAIQVDNNGEYGIRLNSSQGMVVHENQVNLNQNINPTFIAGIKLENCRYTSIECNTVFGNFVGENTLIRKAAIWGDLTRNTVYVCNNTDKTPIGIRFSGNCMDTDLKGNNINKHQVGLHLSAGTIIGTQIQRGNRWLGPSYSIIGALHEGGSFEAVSSQFYVFPTIINPELMPPTLDPSSWFVNTAGTPYQCNFGICPVGGGLATNSNLNNTDYMVAQNALELGDYPESAKWQNDRNLTEKLTDNNNLIVAGPIAAFYDSIQQTNLYQLYQLKGNVQDMYAVSASSELLNEQYADAKNNFALQIETLDSLLISATNVQQADLQAQKTMLLQQLNNLQITQNIADWAVKDTQQGEAQNLKTENDWIVSTELCAQNEKFVNEVYLSTIANGTAELNAAQTEQLLAIAEQCPLAGGGAVYWARSLYSNINSTKNYNDTDNCAAAGLSYKKEHPTKTNLQTALQLNIYPNPVQDQATLVLSKVLAQNHELIITDIWGTVVAQQNLLAGTIAVPLPINKLPNGCYFCNLYQSGNYICTQKMVIIH